MSSSTNPEYCYCHASRCGARSLTRMYDRHLEPAGISISQFAILAILGKRPGMKSANLATRMVMERSTLVRALKPLRDAGFVQCETTGEGRSLALSLSPLGAEKFAEAMPLWIEAQKEFEESFGLRRAQKLRNEVLATATVF